MTRYTGSRRAMCHEGWHDFVYAFHDGNELRLGTSTRTGDTGPNPLLWERLRQMKVAHLVIETAFSDEERQLARIRRHLCPASLAQELAQLEGSVDVHITHIKPGEMDAVMSKIARLETTQRIHALETGQVMRLG